MHVFLTVAHELTGCPDPLSVVEFSYFALTRCVWCCAGKVAVDDVTDEDWEWIFAIGLADGPPPAASRVPHAVLTAARQAFQHWLVPPELSP